MLHARLNASSKALCAAFIVVAAGCGEEKLAKDTSNNVPTNAASTNNAASNNRPTDDCGDVNERCVGVGLMEICDWIEDEEHPDGAWKLVTYACADVFGPNATCVDGFYGWAYCAVGAGERCATWDHSFPTGAGQAACRGDLPACIWSSPTHHAVCQTGFAGSRCDEDTFTEGCVGDVYVYDCIGGHVVGFDCAALGGGACSLDGACLMPAGGSCDDGDVFCRDGLTCNYVTDSDWWGTCG